MGYEKLKRIHFRSLFLAIVPGKKTNTYQTFQSVFAKEYVSRNIAKISCIIAKVSRFAYIAKTLFILQNLESVLDSYTYIHK